MTNIDKTMNENEQEIIDSTNDTETTENPEEAVEEESEEVAEEESVEDLKKKLATIEAQKEHWRKKAEKPKEVPKVEKPEVPVGTSIKDQIALLNAKVHEDDVDEVLEYARFKKISVAEALKSNVIKASLAEKSEQRATAEASHTSKSRGTVSKTTGETLLAKAEKSGEVPDSDDDMDRMLEARYSR